MGTRSEKNPSQAIGAHVLHGTHDSRVITAPARAKFLSQFERQVRDADPDGLLSDAEVERRAAHLKRAYFLQLANRSVKARAARRRAAR